MESILSVKNSSTGRHKVITILGFIRIKLRRGHSHREEEGRFKSDLNDLQVRFSEELGNLRSEIKDIEKRLSINVGDLTELAALKYKFLEENNLLPQTPLIKSDLETITALINSPKSLIRFGDGEFGIMLGKHCLFEEANEALKDKLLEIFRTDNDNLLIGTRYDLYRCDRQARYVNLNDWRWQYILNKHKEIAPLYNYGKVYYSSVVNMPFIVYRDDYNYEIHYELLRRIWDNKSITIIAGDRVFNNIEYNVFDNAKEIEYIDGPTDRAFEKYDELKERVSMVSKEKILIFALGPCGKCIGYDMFRLGYRVLDLGHLIKDYDLYRKFPHLSLEDKGRLLRSFAQKD